MERAMLAADLREAFDQFPDGVGAATAIRSDGGWIVDFRMTYMNPVLGRLAGLDPASVVGRRMLELVPQFGPMGTVGVYARVIKTGVPFEFEADFDGSFGPWHVRGRFELRAMRLGADGVLAVFRDVTTLRRGEEELRRSHAELERFADVAAHDLREPLLGIRQLTALVESGDERRRAQALELIRATAERGLRLVDGLRDVARIGRGAPSAEPVDLDRLAAELVASLGPAIDAAGGEVTREPLPTVRGDEPELWQVLANLVGNALKFGGDGPRVRIRAERAGGRWTISVEDRGPGVRGAHRERIFDIFARAHADEDAPGSGVGLAICRKVVERHGGRIWVEDRPGGGSAFRFTLPAAPAEQP